MQFTQLNRRAASLCSLLLGISIILAATKPGYTQSNIMVQAKSHMVDPGASNETTVDFMAGNQSIGAFSIEVLYDPTIITVTDCALTDFTGACNTTITGKVLISAVAPAGQTGDSTAVTLRFDAIGSAGDVSPITLNLFTLVESGTGIPLSHTITNSEVIINQTAPVATSTPTSLPTNTPLPIATSTPTSLPTNTPLPIATSTPTALPTNTPLAVATATPTSLPTNTPLPDATAMPTSLSTNTPSPVATVMPTSLPTSTPIPTVSSTPFDSSLDTDGDGVPNFAEDINGNGDVRDDDTDGDGLPNYLDRDDDGDGVFTILEDANKDGQPMNDDVNSNGVPDYLDVSFSAASQIGSDPSQQNQVFLPVIGRNQLKTDNNNRNIVELTATQTFMSWICSFMDNFGWTSDACYVK